MESIDYILSELNRFVISFSKTRVRYEYDELSRVHFVEIVPSAVYHFDTEYIKWESDFFDSFIDMFPYENICFISDDALVSIETPIMTIQGEKYAPVSTERDIAVINPEDIVFGQGKVSPIDFDEITFAELKGDTENTTSYITPSEPVIFNTNNLLAA